MRRNNNNNRRSRTNQNPSDRITIPNQIYSTSFPRQMKVSLKYHHGTALTTTSGIANDHIFNLNSIFDPDRTGVGHQPQGRDQWAMFYNRYRVDSVVATIRSIGASTHGTLTGFLANNDGTAITDPDEFGESYGSISGIATTTQLCYLSKKYNLHAVTGITPRIYQSDDRYQSLMSTSPTEVICLHVCTYEVGAGGAVVVNYDLVLTYNVTLFDPIQISSS